MPTFLFAVEFGAILSFRTSCLQLNCGNWRWFSGHDRQITYEIIISLQSEVSVTCYIVLWTILSNRNHCVDSDNLKKSVIITSTNKQQVCLRQKQPLFICVFFRRSCYYYVKKTVINERIRNGHVHRCSLRKKRYSEAVA